MANARFEVVVRIVRDDPEKTEEPKFRHVVQEIAAPVLSEWDLTAGPPQGLTPQEIMALTPFQIFQQVAGPVIDEMRKMPLDMMAFQCVEQLRSKLHAEKKLQKAEAAPR